MKKTERIALTLLLTAVLIVCTENKIKLIKLLELTTQHKRPDYIIRRVLEWEKTAQPSVIKIDYVNEMVKAVSRDKLSRKCHQTRWRFTDDEIEQIDAAMVKYKITTTGKPSSQLRPRCLLFLSCAYLMYGLDHVADEIKQIVDKKLNELYYKVKPKEKSDRKDSTQKPLQGVGSKSDAVFYKIKKDLMLRAYETGKRIIAEPCLGFCGVQPLQLLEAQMAQDMTWKGNDLDAKRIEYYKRMKKKLKSLKTALKKAVEVVRQSTDLHDNWYNATTRDKVKEMIRGTLIAAKTKNDVISAVMTYCDYWISIPSRHTVDDFIDRLDNYINNIIDDMQQMIACCKLSSKDASAFLASIIRQIDTCSSTFVFFDPPYLCCGSVYHFNAQSFKQHAKWAKQLHKLHEQGGDFALCCRVGSGAKDVADRLRKDMILAMFYHTNYARHGYYYADVYFHGAIERVITSLDMSGIPGWHRYI